MTVLLKPYKSLAPDSKLTNASDMVDVTIVDSDIHVNPRNGMEIADHMPEPWLGKGYRELLFAGGLLGTSVIFAPPNEGRRLDAFTPAGPAGSPADDGAAVVRRDRGGHRHHHSTLGQVAHQPRT